MPQIKTYLELDLGERQKLGPKFCKSSRVLTFHGGKNTVFFLACLDLHVQAQFFKWGILLLIFILPSLNSLAFY